MNKEVGELEVVINSPWTNGDQVFIGMLGFIQQAIQQLYYFQKGGNDTQHIKDDIAGYEEILKSGSEENAQAFMEEKSEHRGELSHSNNLKVINILKTKGAWK